MVLSHWEKAKHAQVVSRYRDRDTCVFSKQILLKGIYNILKLSSLFILFIHYKQQYDTENDIVFVLTALEIVGCYDIFRNIQAEYSPLTIFISDL